MNQRLFFLTLLLSTLGIPTSAMTQTRLGAELTAGRMDMLIPYIADRTYLDANNYAVIGDEAIGGGLSATLRVLLMTTLEAQISYTSLNRTSLVVSQRSISRVNEQRQRTNGTIDDSGIPYRNVDKEVIDLDFTYQGNLTLISLMAGYRYYFFDYEGFYGFAKGGGGLSLAKINGEPYNWSLGIQLYTGIGGVYKLLNAFGISLQVTFETFISTNYFSSEDASRVIYRKNGYTEQAVFDLTILSNVQAGIHYSFQ